MKVFIVGSNAKGKKAIQEFKTQSTTMKSRFLLKLLRQAIKIEYTNNRIEILHGHFQKIGEYTSLPKIAQLQLVKECNPILYEFSKAFGCEREDLEVVFE